MNLSLGSDIYYCPGSTNTLDAGVANTYKWGSNTQISGSNRYLIATFAGTYWIEATNTANCIERDTMSILLTKDTLDARYLVNSDIFVGDTIHFIELSRGNTQSVEWYFGDGSKSKLANPKKVYNYAGTYRIGMIVFNGSCYDTLIKKITIKSVADARFEFETILPKENELTYIKILVFSVSPNPTTDNLNYNLILSEEAEIKFYIISVDGKILFQKNTFAKSMTSSYDLTNEASGIYYVRVFVNGKALYKKVVKM